MDEGGNCVWNGIILQTSLVIGIMFIVCLRFFQKKYIFAETSANAYYLRTLGQLKCVLEGLVLSR